jgi:hypothetical protein
VPYFLFVSALHAQHLLLVTCDKTGPCLFRRVYTVTVQGKNTVKTLPFEAASNTQLLRKARSARLDSIPGVYREPGPGPFRVFLEAGRLGNVVLPSKLPADPALTALAAWEGVTFEFKEQPRSKTGVPVPSDRLIALLRASSPENAAVDFVRNEVAAPTAHPLREHLVRGALQFAARTQELQRWRDELRSTMRSSLGIFREEKIDPRQLEATLDGGLAAMRVYQLVADDGEAEEVLKQELIAEHRKLIQRFAVAAALRNASLYDPYLEKMQQIGLARWSRPEITNGIDEALQASASLHHKRAIELFTVKQYGRAFDEARIASERAPCDPAINEYYYLVRAEFVNQNMIPTTPEYDKEHRSILQQIVRELQALSQEATLTPERIEYVHKRIAEGERLDKDYRPLQLKKAEFLANLGELTAAREVVSRVERTVQLDRKEAEEWLRLDANLNGRLATTKARAEKLVADHFAGGKFKDALDAAATGLKAEPSNPKLLYFSALASAVLRDGEKTKHCVEQYLRFPSPSCFKLDKATQTLFDLYRRESERTTSAVANRIPHWISGERYEAGEIFYDPVSGAFFPHILTSTQEKGITTTFHWEGFIATSITTTRAMRTGAGVPKETIVFEIEPRYDRKHVCMTAVGSKAGSADDRQVIDLRYLNSPDLDPVLASEFTGRTVTRGWAGNPFFHPFIWSGIFVFDLTYDELGRLKEATPVTLDASRPRSSFSESLKFSWDGKSKRLLSIGGERYRRTMEYDKQGRLRSERIVYPRGRGKIEYVYVKDTPQLRWAKCGDNFFEKSSRKIYFAPVEQ